MVKEKVKKNFVAEVMNTSLFSIEEKLKIINKVRKDDLSDREINDILKFLFFLLSWLKILLYTFLVFNRVSFETLYCTMSFK